jgi:rare lipoprotein A
VQSVANILIAVTVLVALSACANTSFNNKYAPDDYAAEAGHGACRIGAPYQIGGKTYYPKADWHYDEEGVASWYSPDRNGHLTANGEVYDEARMTAAHPTLQLPAIVSVTNLANGKSVVVRVNDRGPFVHTRLIELSRKAAGLLGFERAGTARVRVRLMVASTEKLWQSCR